MRIRAITRNRTGKFNRCHPYPNSVTMEKTVAATRVRKSAARADSRINCPRLPAVRPVARRVGTTSPTEVVASNRVMNRPYPRSPEDRSANQSVATNTRSPVRICFFPCRSIWCRSISNPERNIRRKNPSSARKPMTWEP